MKRTLTWRARQVRSPRKVLGMGTHGDGDTVVVPLLPAPPVCGVGAVPAHGGLGAPRACTVPTPTRCLPTVLFKEVNTCNPATITGTLSRISLDGDEDPKLNTTSEGGLGFSSLPGNIPAPSILVQVPKMPPNVVAELGEPPAQPVGLEAQGPVYLCTESSLRPVDYGWLRAPEPPRESDYMVLPRRSASLKPFQRDEGQLEEGAPGGKGRPAGEGDAYPSFISVEHVNVNLSQPYGTVKHPYGLQFKQHPTVRQILASELSERSRTMPRTVPGSAMKVGSLEVSGGALGSRGMGWGAAGGLGACMGLGAPWRACATCVRRVAEVPCSCACCLASHNLLGAGSALPGAAGLLPGPAKTFPLFPFLLLLLPAAPAPCTPCQRKRLRYSDLDFEVSRAAVAPGTGGGCPRAGPGSVLSRAGGAETKL